MFNNDDYIDRELPIFPISNNNPNTLNLHIWNKYLLNEELDNSYEHDKILIGLSFIIVWVLLIFFYIRQNFIRSRIGLSFVTILTLIFTFLSSIGAVSGMGYKYNWYMLVLSFFLTYIGCNLMSLVINFIIPFSSNNNPFLINHFRFNFWWIQRFGVEVVSIETGISAGISFVGPFIFISCFIVFCSLLTGAYTSISGFRAFCLFSAFCMIFLFIFIFTFFLPCIILDARRQSQKR
jgi:hypothetical protein